MDLDANPREVSQYARAADAQKFLPRRQPQKVVENTGEKYNRSDHRQLQNARQRPMEHKRIAKRQNQSHREGGHVCDHNGDTAHARHGRRMLFADAIRMIKESEPADAIANQRRQDECDQERQRTECENQEQVLSSSLYRFAQPVTLGSTLGSVQASELQLTLFGPGKHSKPRSVWPKPY